MNWSGRSAILSPVGLEDLKQLLFPHKLSSLFVPCQDLPLDLYLSYHVLYHSDISSLYLRLSSLQLLRHITSSPPIANTLLISTSAPHHKGKQTFSEALLERNRLFGCLKKSKNGRFSPNQDYSLKRIDRPP